MKLIAAVCFAVTVVGVNAAAWAQQPQGGWIADPKTGCRVWNNYPRPDDRITYEGHCVGGFADGQGVTNWFSKGKNYEKDIGEFKKGKMDGHIKMTDESGTFDGQFRDQKPNGFGTFKANDGEVFSGQWIEGCFNDGKRRAQYNALDGCNFSS